MLAGLLDTGSQLRALVRGGLRLWSLQGTLKGQAAPLCLDYLGPAGSVHEFDLLFDGAVTVGRASTRPDAVLAPAPLDLWPGQWLRFFPFLQASLPVAASVDAQISAVGSKPHRRRLHALQRSDQYTWRTSSELADFDRFLTELHLPYVSRRFQEHALSVDVPALRERFGSRGVALEVRHEGALVAGALLFKHGARLHYERSGYRPDCVGQPPLLAERTAAVELGVFQTAQRLRARSLELGFCRAFLDDGLFTHKRRLGCHFERAQGTTAYALWVRPGLRAAFFSAAPLVAGHGEALEVHLGFCPGAAASPSRARALGKNFAIPAVKRVVVWARGTPGEVDGFCASMAEVFAGREVSVRAG